MDDEKRHRNFDFYARKLNPDSVMWTYFDVIDQSGERVWRCGGEDRIDDAIKVAIKYCGKVLKLEVQGFYCRPGEDFGPANREFVFCALPVSAKI